MGKTFYDIHPNINLEEEKRNYEILLTEGSVSNVLELYKKNGEKYYVHVVSQLGQYHAKEVIISVASDVTELKKTELKIRAMALHDSLTQLYNRYKFDEFCSEQVEIYNRYKTVSSLIICDIDYFKKVNDTYGHLTGDEVLKAIAKTIQSNVRASDIVSRWGGEEFAILLPNSSLDQAYQFACKINKAVESSIYCNIEDITISCGVSQIEEGDTVMAWFKRVDEALYDAKQSGRNKVKQRCDASHKE